MKFEIPRPRAPRCWPQRSAAWSSAPAAAQAKEQFFPVLPYRTGAYAPNGVPLGQRLRRLPQAGQCARRHQRREDHLRGMRNRLRHRQGRRVLRAPEGQARRRDRVPAAVHRHHLRADREGAGRQDPADHRRLRPQRKAGRQRLQVELPAARHLLGWRPTSLVQHIGKKEGGLDKLKGKKIALVYHDSPYGKEPIPLLQERGQDATASSCNCCR